MSNAKDDFLNQLPQAFKQWLGSRQVDDVECIVADIAGMSRGKAMPWRKFTRVESMYLPTSIFQQTINGDYIDLENSPEQWKESDLCLVPDFSTATAVPWSDDTTLQVIHDVEDRNGSPIMVAPRNILKKVLSLYDAEGWTPIVSPELEFYLTKPNINPDHPIEPPIGRSGRQGVARQAYSMTAVEEYGKVIDDIYDFAEAQGFEIDTIIQEGGAGQIEINLQHGNPLALADQVFYYKRTIREAAMRNDCFATFMAKPMEDQPGSAMHIHQSVVDKNTGKNLFTREDDSPSELFYHFIGGQQEHLPSVVCILAPYVNSYRRFTREDAAPINIEWAEDNRTTGLRIPLSPPSARRVENRVVGMDCNPYLAIAASLACGYLGMKNAIAPRDPVHVDAYSLPRALPYGLHAAIELFEANTDMREILSEEFCQTYTTIKQHETEAYGQVISPWEREHLLLNV